MNDATPVVTISTSIMHDRHAVDTTELITALKSIGILPQTLNIFLSCGNLTKIELFGTYEGQSETAKIE